MLQSDKSLGESSLAKRISESLALHMSPLAREVAGRPVESIAVIETKAIVVYLLAISVFDENNNAYANPDDLREAIRSLASFYDRNGQGHDLYAPLMGTGLSRAGMLPREAYEMLVTEFCSDNILLTGKVTLVMPPDMVEAIGLAD